MHSLHGPLVTPTSLVSAELLVQIGDAIPHVVFVINGQTGALEHVSERFSELTRAPTSEALGHGYRAFLYDGDFARVLHAARSSLRSGQPLRTDVRLRDRDGVHRWHEVRATPIRSSRSRVRRWFGTCTYVDDTRRADATQRDVAALTLALASVRTPAEVLTSFARAVVEALADVCAIDLDRGTESPERVAFAIAPELGPAMPPGAPTSVTIEPLVAPGTRVGHVALGTLGRATPFDARDREMLDDLMRRLTFAYTSACLLESAQTAAHVRDEFLAVISQELRTPLSTILGWARLIRAEPRNEARRVRGLEVIERSAATQGRMIDDLLDMSRAMSGELRLAPQEVSLSALVRDTAASMRPAATEKGLTMDVATQGLATVRVDPERIRQVTVNLLSNAVKFTPAGGAVSLHVSASGGVVRIEVTDNGIGIDPTFLPYLFERFRRADASWARRQAGGLGLGLALVRAIVEQHGGRVRAESGGLGCGTRVVVELPERARVGSTPPPPKAELHTPSGDLFGVRVLVVDDDADARDLCALILGMHGARVSTAESAADAMVRLQSAAIQVMISDIGMPVEDGCSLALRAIGRHPDLRCVALSAYARREDGERALDAGFRRYLPKPVDPSVLVRVVREVAASS